MERMVVRPPQQARTREAWARILDAGLALIEEVGFDGLTIAAVCERAHVTPPTIYARAANKEALLRALYEHALERLEADDTLNPSDPQFAGMAAEPLVRAAVASVCRVWLGHAALMRAIVRHSSADPEVIARGSHESVAVGRRFREILAPVASAERADVCFRIVYAALVQRVVFGERFESNLPLSDEQLEVTLGDVAWAYLRGEGQR